MISLYFCKTENRHEQLEKILLKEYGAPVKVLRDNGRPYAENDEIFFSISHSGELCCIAVSQTKVGVDTELLQIKHCKNILNSLPLREQKEICSNADFLAHWTARESYAKLHGKPIFSLFRKLEFSGGKMFLSGVEVPEKITFCHAFGAVTAICSQQTDYVIKTLQ